MHGRTLNSFSEEWKLKFLLEFTRQLIMNSGGNIFELEHILEDKEEEKEKKQSKEFTTIFEQKKEAELRQGVPGAEMEVDKEKISRMFKPLPSVPQIRQNRSRVLRIPEPKLPPRFQYLKPTPGNENIDLEKLNPFVKDPMVRNIECSGAGENIMVVGSMGRKPTGVVLSSEEIDDIIDRFSKAAKIPIQEGVFKVVVGKLIFSAVISNVVGSKFIIRKMTYNPYFRG